MLSERKLMAGLGAVAMAVCLVAAAAVLTSGNDSDGDEAADTGSGRVDRVIGGYFDGYAITASQVELVRADSELGDDVSDDDLAQSTEAACVALQNWPGETAEALLNQGIIPPDQDWQVAPRVAAMEPAELIYFVQSAQANLCSETAERIRLAICELSPQEIEDGVEC